MPVEAHRLVLREHQHLAQAAVEAVGEREVDDAVAAAEGHRRLGPVARQRLQPRAFAAGQDHRQDVLHATLSHAWSTPEHVPERVILSLRQCGLKALSRLPAGSNVPRVSIAAPTSRRRCERCTYQPRPNSTRQSDRTLVDPLPVPQLEDTAVPTGDGRGRTSPAGVLVEQPLDGLRAESSRARANAESSSTSRE